MKKLILILLAISLALGLMGGAFAAFSDEETSTGNTFTAGTMDLKVDMDPTSGVEWHDSPLYYVIWLCMKPGNNLDGNFSIKNEGCVEGVAGFTLTVTADDDNGLTEPESDVDVTPGPLGEGELSQYIDVTLSYNGIPVYSGTMAGLSAAGTQYAPTNIAGGATASWEYTLSVGAGVGNIIQSDSCTFDVVFSLDQAP